MIMNVIRLILMETYILCIHGCLFMFYNIKMINKEKLCYSNYANLRKTWMFARFCRSIMIVYYCEKLEIRM